MPDRDIVVVGGSAGAVSALQRLAGSLPVGLPAALFVVVHFPGNARSALPDILNRAGPLPAHHAVDGEEIVPGQIYVAPPNFHLLVQDSRVGLSLGPKENGVRPAIDPLFRSAALAYGERVVGVVLSGTLADGSAGLAIIKQHGGLAVVQDPEEAEYPDMPTNALESITVDYTLPARGIGRKLAELAGQSSERRGTERSGHMAENTQRQVDLPTLDDAVARSAVLSTPSGIACPACGGAMWEKVEAGVTQYRCYFGHNYALANLLASQWDVLEGALWTAARSLQERAALLRRLADQAEGRPSTRTRQEFRSRAEELEQQASTIRQILERASQLR